MSANPLRSIPEWDRVKQSMAEFNTETAEILRRVNPLKLNLGCSDRLIDGFVNVDLEWREGVVVADLRNEVWPWPNSSVSNVIAHDIIEHLPDKIHTMNELWRVLQNGRTADIIVPTTDGPGAFQDPTHTSFWNRRSFKYYTAGDPYRERFAKAYGILAAFKVKTEHMNLTVDGPKLQIVMEAVK